MGLVLRLGSTLAGVKSQINRSGNELPGVSKSTSTLPTSITSPPVMDGCKHHPRRPKRND